MDSGQWAVDSKQWAVYSKQWAVDSKPTAVESKQWAIDSGLLMFSLAMFGALKKFLLHFVSHEEFTDSLRCETSD